MTATYLLDTNVVSELSRPLPDPSVTIWLEAVSTPCLSAITVGELRKGFQLLPHGRRRRDLEERIGTYLLRPDIHVLPVTEQIAVRWGELSAQRQRMGRPLPVLDGLIAATALEHGLVLATRNVKDFFGLDLALFDPWQDHTRSPGDQA